MKFGIESKFSKAKATGGIVGATLAGVAIAAGIGVFLAAPVVVGVIAGTAVAGAVSGAGGVILGIVAGWAAASATAGPGFFAGLCVAGVGSLAGGAIGAGVAGVVKLAELGVKGAAAGTRKLFSLGKNKAPKKAAAKVTAPATAGNSAFAARTVKTSFEAVAANTTVVVNDNKPVAQVKRLLRLKNRA